MKFADYLFMLVYFMIVMGMGAGFMRRKTSTEDYLMGGRNMPWWAASISYVMALLSTVSLVAVPGEAYTNGMRFAVLEVISPIFMIICFRIFMRFYFESRMFTPFTYLEKRFDGRVRAIMSSIYLFARIAYLALVVYSGSVMFRGVAGPGDVLLKNSSVVILLTGLVAVIYCSLGGLKAVIWTNVFQFVILISSFVSVLIWSTAAVNGGVAGVVDYAFANGRGFNFDSMDSSFFSMNPYVRVTFWLLLWNAVSANVLYNTADQIAIQQLLSTSSFKHAFRSILGATIIILPLSAVMWYCGLAMFAYFRIHPLPDSSGPPPGDMALMQFVSLKLPTPLPGLFVAAMFSALLSTLGAGITSLATVATKDLYVRFFRPLSSDKQEVLISRGFIIGVGAAATLGAMLINISAEKLRESVLEASSIWISITAVVAPTFFVAILNRRCQTLHILISIASGLLVTGGMVAWYLISKQHGNSISFMAIQVPGGLVVLLLGYLLPIAIPRRSSNAVDLRGSAAVSTTAAE